MGKLQDMNNRSQGFCSKSQERKKGKKDRSKKRSRVESNEGWSSENDMLLIVADIIKQTKMGSFKRVAGSGDHVESSSEGSLNGAADYMTVPGEKLRFAPASDFDYGTDNQLVRGIVDLYVTGGYDDNAPLPVEDITYNLCCTVAAVRRCNESFQKLLHERHGIIITGI